MRAKDNMYIHDKKKEAIQHFHDVCFSITMWILSMPLDGIINREKKEYEIKLSHRDSS